MILIKMLICYAIIDDADMLIHFRCYFAAIIATFMLPCHASVIFSAQLITDVY